MFPAHYRFRDVSGERHLFLELKGEYREGEQVLTADTSVGKLKVSGYSGALDRKVFVGAVVGFYHPAR